MAKDQKTPEVTRTNHPVFVGLYSNADPHDLPAGAAQILQNIHCLVPGQLTVRKGVQPSTDFTPSSPTTNDIIGLYGYMRPEGNVILIQDNAGNLKAFRSAASTTLASSLSYDKPGCFAKHRRGHAIFVNGRERGKIWNGTSASAWELGVDPPGSAPTMATPTGGNATAGDYACVYRYLDADKPTGNPSSISDITTTTAAASDKFTWTISPSTQGRVTASGGLVELWRSTVGQATILYRIAQLGNSGTITSIANSGGFVQMTVPEGHNLIVGAKILAAGTGVGGYNTTHEVTAKTATTLTTDIAYSSNATGGTWTLAGFTADTYSDATLETAAENDSETRLVLVSGTEIVARRFTIPPNYKRVAVQHQDRMWYWVDDIYTTGTISTTAGSATVTGSGTSWTTAMAGRYLYCKDIPEPIKISSVGSATSITATLPVSTSVSGKAYGIRPRPDVRNAGIYSEIDEPESVPTESDGRVINIVTAQELTGDDDEITGAIPFGAIQYICKERHIYTLSYFDQPKIDASVSLLAERGMINQRCWKTHEGQIFILDHKGPYMMSTGGEIQDICEPIRDRFRNATIDWSKQDTFFVGVDPIEEIAYFCVCYTGDSGSRPRRAFAYCIRGQKWNDDLYFSDLGGFAYLPISNRVRLLAGGLDDVIWVFNEGTTDGVTSQYLASVTSTSSGTTITCSGASFTAAMIGAPVVVYEGTGKFSKRLITGRTGTTLTIESALSVDSTSRIMVGGIDAKIRLGIHEIPEVEVQNERGIEIVFSPTAGACTIDIRRYWNHDTSPENNSVDDNGRGGAVTTTKGDPDAVLAVRTDRISGTTAAGWGRHLFSGHWTAQMEGKRWFAPEVRWVAGDYSPILYSINVIGAQGGRAE